MGKIYCHSTMEYKLPSWNLEGRDHALQNNSGTEWNTGNKLVETMGTAKNITFALMISPL